MTLDLLLDSFDPAWRPWLRALPLLLLAAATLEGVVLSRRGGHDWRAFAATLGDVAGRRLVDAAGLSVAAPLAAWAWQHRLATWPLGSGGALLLVFVGQELCYYAYHRAAHRVRWLWATHAVHHSPNQLTLASALRLGWTGPLSGTVLFFLPLMLLGCPSGAVLACLALNLLYQFWLHATWVPPLGPLEWLFNTPAHHRVHHASNAAYLDCNFGGVLIVFDRLFGTLVQARPDTPLRYGLTTPLTSHNPLTIALHEWRALVRDLCAARSASAAWQALFGPPEGRPPVHDHPPVAPSPRD